MSKVAKRIVLSDQHYLIIIVKQGMRSFRANTAPINASNPTRYEMVGILFFCFCIGFPAGFFPFLRYLFVHVDVVFHVIKGKKTL